MTRLQFLLRRIRQAPLGPTVSVMPLAQTAATLQSVNPYYFLSQLRPAVQRGTQNLRAASPRHAMTELALTAYLMGMGFDCNTAQVIVEAWEKDEIFTSEQLAQANQLLKQSPADPPQEDEE